MSSRRILRAKRRITSRNLPKHVQFHATSVGASSSLGRTAESQDQNEDDEDKLLSEMPPSKLSRDRTHICIGDEDKYQSLVKFDESVNKALEENNIEQLKELLSSATSTAHLQRLGHKFLMCIFRHEFDQIKCLVEAGLPFESLGDRGCSHVHHHVLAMDQGHSDIAAYLIEHGADVNVTRPGKVSLAHVACRRNDHTFLEKLIANNCNIDAQCSVGFTPLMYACRYGGTECVEKLLANGVNLNLTERVFGKSALHLAAEKKAPFMPQLLCLLLDAGINPNQRDKNDLPPVVTLIENSESTEEALDCLIPASQNVLNMKIGSTGTTVAHITAQHGKLSILNLLVKYGADLTLKDDRGQTVLHRAAISMCPDTVKRMIELEPSNINVQDEKGDSALHVLTAQTYYSSDMGNVWVDLVIPSLVKYGQNFNLLNKSGCTPLITCLSKRYVCVSLAQALVSLTNVHLKDEKGQDALQYFICHMETGIAASSCTYAESSILKHFYSAGLNVAHYFMTYGRRAFISVTSGHVHEGSISVLKELIDMGVDVNLKEGENSALFNALKYSSRIPICMLLLANASFKVVNTAQHAVIYSHCSHDKGLLKLIILAGLKGRTIEHLLQSNFPDFGVPECKKNSEEHRAVSEILKIIRSVPLLVRLCCYKVRDCIASVKAESKFKRLPLPLSVIDMVRCKDIIPCLNLGVKEKILLKKYTKICK